MVAYKNVLRALRVYRLQLYRCYVYSPDMLTSRQHIFRTIQQHRDDVTKTHVVQKQRIDVGFDFNRCMGKWYVIALSKPWMRIWCPVASNKTTTYRTDIDGNVLVCNRQTPSCMVHASQIGVVKLNLGAASLHVSFNDGVSWQQQCVVKAGPLETKFTLYPWILMATPDGQSTWILSRTRTAPELNQIIEYAIQEGCNVSRLVHVHHTEETTIREELMP